jgi:hypothetical protein
MRKKKDSTHVFGFKKVGQDTFFKSWTQVVRPSPQRGVGVLSTWFELGLHSSPMKGVRRAQHLGSGWQSSPSFFLDSGVSARTFKKSLEMSNKY